MKCIDLKERRFVVEMQVLEVEGFEKRVVYNASRAYVMNLHNGEEYPALCDVVWVTLCNFNLWPDQDEQGRFKVPMLSRWRMQEQHGGDRGLPQDHGRQTRTHSGLRQRADAGKVDRQCPRREDHGRRARVNGDLRVETGRSPSAWRGVLTAP